TATAARARGGRGADDRAHGERAARAARDRERTGGARLRSAAAPRAGPSRRARAVEPVEGADLRAAARRAGPCRVLPPLLDRRPDAEAPPRGVRVLHGSAARAAAGRTAEAVGSGDRADAAARAAGP